MFKSVLGVVFALATAATADAATIGFTGTRQNTNPVTIPGTGRCAPTYFSTSVITPGDFSSTGTSNLGDFSATLSHCNLGPAPAAIVDGKATLDFAAGDSLFATYIGGIAPTATPDTFTSTQHWRVTGGTGRFRNATGYLTHSGSVVVGMLNGARVGIYEGTIEGVLNLPAVP